MLKSYDYLFIAREDAMLWRDYGALFVPGTARDGSVCRLGIVLDPAGRVSLVPVQ